MWVTLTQPGTLITPCLYQQEVRDTAHFSGKTISSQYDQQLVRQVTHFSERNLHYNLCYVQQEVGDIVICSEWHSQKTSCTMTIESEWLYILLNGSFIMTISKWMIFHNISTGWHLVLWLTGGESFHIFVQGGLNFISSCPITNSM